VPRALAVTSFAVLFAASCSPRLATAPDDSRSLELGGVHASTIGGVDDQIVVTLAPGATAAAVAAAYGARVVAVQQGFVVLEPDPAEEPADIELRMRDDARVLTVESNSLVIPAESRQKSWAFDDGNGTLQTYEYQPVVAALGIPESHGYGRGDGVKVAVLDTGIDPAHPLFAGRIAGGWDFVYDDPDPTDVRTGLDLDADGVADGAFGHGTHVAGIVTLTAPGAQLLVARVLDSEGRGDVRTVAAGIRWAVSQGAQVINLSLGMLRVSTTINLAIHEAAAAGVVCVASAGNWGSDSPQEYPATSPQVIAVGASDAACRPASFTSYGVFVDLCAPGVGVRSAYPGGEWRLWSGTSMSAPFVAGTAAVIKQRHPEWRMPEVLELLRNSASTLVDVNEVQVGQLGAGGLSVYLALSQLASPPDFRDRAAGDLEAGP
jgi:subtilisin family serine protease